MKVQLHCRIPQECTQFLLKGQPQTLQVAFKSHVAIHRLQTAVFQKQMLWKMGPILFCFIETRAIPESEVFKTFISINHWRLNKTQTPCILRQKILLGMIQLICKTEGKILTDCSIPYMKRLGPAQSKPLYKHNRGRVLSRWF